MKKCGKCKVNKQLSEFYSRKRGPRAGQYYEKCKDCMKLRGRWYYHANRDRQLPLALARRHKAYLKKRKYINRVKDRPCADCGIIYPFYVMDFDHRDRHTKINDVSRMTKANWSLKKIKAEVKKCDIVCSNCHRSRTYKRLAEVAKVVTAGL